MQSFLVLLSFPTVSSNIKVIPANQFIQLKPGIDAEVRSFPRRPTAVRWSERRNRCSFRQSTRSGETPAQLDSGIPDINTILIKIDSLSQLATTTRMQAILNRNITVRKVNVVPPILGLRKSYHH